MNESMVEAARELFFRYGIRSVTMDDLARHLGVSKKTFYQHFNDKAELVKAVTELQLKEEQQFIEQVHEESTHALDAIMRITDYIRKMIRQFHPSLLFDLQKYYPESWSMFQDYKHCCMLNSIQENIEQGIEEGYYRKELNPRILSHLRMSSIEMVFNPNFFPPREFDLREVQLQMLDHFIHGIVTEKGRKLWEAHTKKHFSFQPTA